MTSNDAIQNQESQEASPERHHGVVTAILLSRGFGFLLSESRQSIFFHVDKCEDRRIPVVGDKISYVLSNDRIGRPVALCVRIETVGAQ